MNDYDDIFNTDTYLLDNLIEQKQFFIESYNKTENIYLRKHMNSKINNINKKINELCVHTWVDDMVDITPDKSIYITYCSKCELTKKNI